MAEKDLEKENKILKGELNNLAKKLDEKDKASKYENLTNNVLFRVEGKELFIKIDLSKPDHGENPEVVAAAIGSVTAKNKVMVKLYEPGRGKLK